MILPLILLAGTTFNPGEVLKSAGGEMTMQAAPVQHEDIVDLTGEALPLLLSVYTNEELAGAGPVVINWSSSDEVFSALVPNWSGTYEDCVEAERCILVRESWWRDSGWNDQPSVRRILSAHEFSHVLSMERKETDVEYRGAVNRVDEECLADATAAYVLNRGGYRPIVTEDYNMAYQCEQFWLDEHGESRADETAALAVDLLEWAAHRWDPEPITESINTPAVADEGAVRISVEQ